jgi:hypothetical protein
LVSEPSIGRAQMSVSEQDRLRILTSRRGGDKGYERPG